MRNNNDGGTEKKSGKDNDMDKQLIVRELKNCTNGRPFIR